MEAPDHRHTFILRLSRGDGGVLSGVIERVRNGEKQRFDSITVLAEIITAMVERETTMRRQKGPTR